MAWAAGGGAGVGDTVGVGVGVVGVTVGLGVGVVGVTVGLGVGVVGVTVAVGVGVAGVTVAVGVGVAGVTVAVVMVLVFRGTACCPPRMEVLRHRGAPAGKPASTHRSRPRPQIAGHCARGAAGTLNCLSRCKVVRPAGHRGSPVNPVGASWKCEAAHDTEFLQILRVVPSGVPEVAQQC